MSTTVLLIEILITGFFTFIWVICLILFPSYDYQLSFGDVKEIYKALPPLTFPILLVIFYQLGWAMNYVSYWAAKWVYADRLKKKLIKDHPELGPVLEILRSERSLIYLKAPASFIKNLNEQIGIYRMARSGMINFLVIGVVAFLNKPINCVILIILFFLFLICIFQGRFTYKVIINQILGFYQNSEDVINKRMIKKNNNKKFSHQVIF